MQFLHIDEGIWDCFGNIHVDLIDAEALRPTLAVQQRFRHRDGHHGIIRKLAFLAEQWEGLALITPVNCIR